MSYKGKYNKPSFLNVFLIIVTGKNQIICCLIVSKGGICWKMRRIKLTLQKRMLIYNYYT